MTTGFLAGKQNIIKLFEKTGVLNTDVLKSGTFGIAKGQRWVLWIKTANKASSPVATAQLYDVCPESPDTAPDATGPTDKVAHGTTSVNTANAVTRKQYGAMQGDGSNNEVMSNNSYLEITMSGSGSCDLSAWIEILP